MLKRVTAFLLCLIMLAALPLSAFAAEPDNAAPAAPAAVRYAPSGSITIGTATLYDPDGNELPLEYAYSPRVTMSGSIADQLTVMLSQCGFSLPGMQFDYQLMNMQSFFAVRVTDGQALARTIDAMISRAASAPDEPEISDNTAVSSSDAVSGSDLTAAVSASDVSASDVSATDIIEPQPQTSTQPESEDSSIAVPPQNVTTSLHSLLFGAASFDAYPTLEQSFDNAFPEFTFSFPTAVPLPQTLNAVSGIVVAEDGMSAQLTVTPEPEYVEREMFGEVFQVLMVSSVAYRYELYRKDIAGVTDGAVIPEKPVVSPTDVTTTTTETTTTVTTTATTTSTAAQTTDTTSTTTTTTTAPTTTTTQNAQGYPRTGVVTTTWKRLNVRTGPGLEYKVITQLNKGTSVTVIDYQNGWYKVQLSNGTTGWCTDEYITLK